jgi:hypothetical protein
MWMRTAEGLVNLERFDSIGVDTLDASAVLVLFADGEDALYVKCASPEQADRWLHAITEGFRSRAALVELD